MKKHAFIFEILYYLPASYLTFQILAWGMEWFCPFKQVLGMHSHWITFNCCLKKFTCFQGSKPNKIKFIFKLNSLKCYRERFGKKNLPKLNFLPIRLCTNFDSFKGSQLNKIKSILNLNSLKCYRERYTNKDIRRN